MDQTLRRREFLKTVAAPLALTALGGGAMRTVEARRIRAVALDGFAVFDAGKATRDADAIAPGRGRELVAAWRTRQFEYQWLRTLGGQYADFRRTADDALSYAIKSLGLTISSEEHRRLVDAQLTLTPWPDAADAIRALSAAGLRLVFLSNMTEAMLEAGAKRAGFHDAFERILSTDRVRASKPDPRAYRMAVDALGLPREQIAFVAFAGWDAAGAAWFGYPTVWMNRLSAPADELAVEPRAVTHNLADVVSLVGDL